MLLREIASTTLEAETLYNAALNSNINDVVELAMSAAQNVVDTYRTALNFDDTKQIKLFNNSIIDLLSSPEVQGQPHTTHWFKKRGYVA